MTGTRNARASSKARDEIITQLKDDHRRVKKAYRDFQKLDSDEDADACAAIVQQVIAELTVHAALEEELLYPAIREVVSDEALIDEAEVEHETLHMLIDKLRGLAPGDDKYAAHFTVLCEYVLHHVKEEEGEIFPELARARLDWDALASEMSSRREELTAEEGAVTEGEGPEGGVAAAARSSRDEQGGVASQRR
jgi:hemerythrin superfamily protein